MSFKEGEISNGTGACSGGSGVSTVGSGAQLSEFVYFLSRLRLARRSGHATRHPALFHSLKP